MVGVCALVGNRLKTHLYLILRPFLTLLLVLKVIYLQPFLFPKEVKAHKAEVLI